MKQADVAVVLVDLAGGGTYRVVLRLVNAWAARGRDVVLIAPSTDDARWRELHPAVARVELDAPISPDTMVRARRILRQVGTLRRMLVDTRRTVRRSGAPVVVSFLTGSNLLTLAACFGLRRRVVVSERNDPARQDVAWPVRAARRILYPRAGVVTANSAHAANVLARTVRPDRIVVVPNGLDLPADVASPDRSRTLLVVGRLAEHKRHLLLLKAFQRVLADPRVPTDGWRLRIVGDGPMFDRIAAEVAATGLGEQVELTGALGDPGPAYLEAAALVLPSRYEGTPNVVLEAMGHGLPVVVSDSLPGALEHVDDGRTGLAFHSGDVEDLARSLGTLIADPQLRSRMGRNARIDAQAHARVDVVDHWDRAIVT